MKLNDNAFIKDETNKESSELKKKWGSDHSAFFSDHDSLDQVSISKEAAAIVRIKRPSKRRADWSIVSERAAVEGGNKFKEYTNGPWKVRVEGSSGPSSLNTGTTVKAFYDGDEVESKKFASPRNFDDTFGSWHFNATFEKKNLDSLCNKARRVALAKAQKLATDGNQPAGIAQRPVGDSLAPLRSEEIEGTGKIGQAAPPMQPDMPPMEGQPLEGEMPAEALPTEPEVSDNRGLEEVLTDLQNNVLSLTEKIEGGEAILHGQEVEPVDGDSGSIPSQSTPVQRGGSKVAAPIPSKKCDVCDGGGKDLNDSSRLCSACGGKGVMSTLPSGVGWTDVDKPEEKSLKTQLPAQKQKKLVKVDDERLTWIKEDVSKKLLENLRMWVKNNPTIDPEGPQSPYAGLAQWRKDNPDKMVSDSPWGTKLMEHEYVTKLPTEYSSEGVIPPTRHEQYTQESLERDKLRFQQIVDDRAKGVVRAPSSDVDDDMPHWMRQLPLEDQAAAEANRIVSERNRFKNSFITALRTFPTKGVGKEGIPQNVVSTLDTMVVDSTEDWLDFCKVINQYGAPEVEEASGDFKEVVSPAKYPKIMEVARNVLLSSGGKGVKTYPKEVIRNVVKPGLEGKTTDTLSIGPKEKVKTFEELPDKVKEHFASIYKEFGVETPGPVEVKENYCQDCGNYVKMVADVPMLRCHLCKGVGTIEEKPNQPGKPCERCEGKGYSGKCPHWVAHTFGEKQITLEDKLKKDLMEKSKQRIVKSYNNGVLKLDSIEDVKSVVDYMQETHKPSIFTQVTGFDRDEAAVLQANAKWLKEHPGSSELSPVEKRRHAIYMQELKEQALEAKEAEQDKEDKKIDKIMAEFRSDVANGLIPAAWAEIFRPREAWELHKAMKSTDPKMSVPRSNKKKWERFLSENKEKWARLIKSFMSFAEEDAPCSICNGTGEAPSKKEADPEGKCLMCKGTGKRTDLSIEKSKEDAHFGIAYEMIEFLTALQRPAQYGTLMSKSGKEAVQKAVEIKSVRSLFDELEGQHPEAMKYLVDEYNNIVLKIDKLQKILDSQKTGSKLPIPKSILKDADSRGITPELSMMHHIKKLQSQADAKKPENILTGMADDAKLKRLVEEGRETLKRQGKDPDAITKRDMMKMWVSDALQASKKALNMGVGDVNIQNYMEKTGRRFSKEDEAVKEYGEYLTRNVGSLQNTLRDLSKKLEAGEAERIKTVRDLISGTAVDRELILAEFDKSPISFINKPGNDKYKELYDKTERLTRQIDAQFKEVRKSQVIYQTDAEMVAKAGPKSPRYVQWKADSGIVTEEKEIVKEYVDGLLNVVDEEREDITPDSELANFLHNLGEAIGKTGWRTQRGLSACGKGVHVIKGKLANRPKKDAPDLYEVVFDMADPELFYAFTKELQKGYTVDVAHAEELKKDRVRREISQIYGDYADQQPDNQVYVQKYMDEGKKKLEEFNADPAKFLADPANVQFKNVYTQARISPRTWHGNYPRSVPKLDNNGNEIKDPKTGETVTREVTLGDLQFIIDAITTLMDRDSRWVARGIAMSTAANRVGGKYVSKETAQKVQKEQESMSPEERKNRAREKVRNKLKRKSDRVAVDNSAKQYWEELFGTYGEIMTKDRVASIVDNIDSVSSEYGVELSDAHYDTLTRFLAAEYNYTPSESDEDMCHNLLREANVNPALASVLDKVILSHVMQHLSDMPFPHSLDSSVKYATLKLSLDADTMARAAEYQKVAEGRMKLPKVEKQLSDAVKVEKADDEAEDMDLARPAHLLMEVTDSRKVGAYTQLDISWDPDSEAAKQSASGLQNAVISFLKGLESKKEFGDLGFCGGAVFKEFDPDAGVATVSFRTQKGDVAIPVVRMDDVK